VARWLRSSLESTGNYSIDIHDLATSSKDNTSRRLARPKTWFRRSLRSPSGSDDGVQHWGANAVEVEFMRYRPRVELTRALRYYDIIHVITGGPALAAAVKKGGHTRGAASFHNGRVGKKVAIREPTQSGGVRSPV
jgi:hypothetical protein